MTFLIVNYLNHFVSLRIIDIIRQWPIPMTNTQSLPTKAIMYKSQQVKIMWKALNKEPEQSGSKEDRKSLSAMLGSVILP